MYFFQGEVEETFSTFDLTHIIVLLISIVVLLLLFIKRDVIANSSKSQKIGYFIGGLLLTMDILFYVWKWSTGRQPYFPIPMHLCSWATYIVSMSFFIKNKYLFHFALYYGTIGGLLSLLVPEFGGYTYNHIRFYQFFLLHFLILAGPAYQSFVYKFKIDFKIMAPIVLGGMYLQAFLAWIVNNFYVTLFEEEVANMLYTQSPPVALPGILGNTFVYYLIFGLLFLVIWYGYSKLLNKLNHQ